VDWRWFNASSPFWYTPAGPYSRYRRWGVRLWNVFNRVSTQGHYWGIGVLQVSIPYVGWGNRHLFYVGRDDERIVWSVLFIGRTS
jgi:hypothetical protein